MKTMKYFVVGALLSISATSMAQDVNYHTALEPISKAMKENPAAVEKMAKAYISQFKKDPQALISLGSAYLAVRNFDKADEIADMVIAKSKKDMTAQSEAYILKGDIEAVKDQQGDGGAAASHYATAMSLDPKNPQGYMRYAAVYRSISPKIVEDTYAKLRQERPDFPIDAEAGHSFFSGGKFAKAFENYAKCNMNQLEEDKLVEYLIAAFQTSKYADASKIASFGGNKFAKNATFAQLGMWSAVENKNFNEALTTAQRYFAMEGDKNATDHTYYGKAFLGAEKYTEALAQFNKALEVNADATEPLAKISETYMKMGNEDTALEYSEKYMQKNKNASPSDYANLAGIYTAKADKGIDPATNYNKAINIYDQMGAKFPVIASWANMIAAGIADKSGNTDLGASYNQKIVDELYNKANRDSDETGYLIQALRLLGFHYWSDKNDLEAAKPYYEMLIKLDPADKNARAALGLDQEAPAASE